MNRSPIAYTALASLVGTLTIAAFVGGCGGDDTAQVGDDGGVIESGIGDGTAGGDGSGNGDGNVGDGAACGLLGMSCASSGDCCSAECDATKHCANPIGQCKTAGTACGTSNECCTFVCSGGACGATLCTSDNQPCTSNASCCGGVCSSATDGGAKTCKPLNPSCRTSGNTCTTSAECCSSFCANGTCSSRPSFCTQTGDICSTDNECCGGLCNKGVGASLGTCAVPAAPGGTMCTIAGEVCGGVADGGADGGIPTCGGSCCSRACAPFGPTEVFICEPPSGCRPTGELCRTSSDCCGGPGVPGGNGSVSCSKANANDPVGRCDNGNACRAAGAICKLATTSCNAENNCCAGNVNQDPSVCQQDLLGIPRCTGVGNCAGADAGSYAGKACATSADCCNLLACVPNPVDGGAEFICGTSCVPTAGACTTSADCCPGKICVLPPGASSGTCGGGGGPSPDGGTSGDGGATNDGGTTNPDSGTCSLYGQTCSTGSDCCNGVPCTSGRCIYPIR